MKGEWKIMKLARNRIEEIDDTSVHLLIRISYMQHAYARTLPMQKP